MRLREFNRKHFPFVNEHQQHFTVNVSVIEGRHYPFRNANSVVKVSIGRKRFHTKVQKGTDNPFYNQFFVFDFYCSKDTMMDSEIVFTVFQPRNYWRSRKIIGTASLDVATLWAETGHIFYCKWAVLKAHGPHDSGPRGYLKVTISIDTANDHPMIPENVPDSNEIEGNLLVPEEFSNADSQNAAYIFNIYRADGLSRPKSTFSSRFKAQSTFVQITFAGHTGRTSVSKKNDAPVWDEQIRLFDVFPPMCQRVHIELREETAVGSNVTALRYIYLRDISHDGDKGFLPTFGPTFVHLYNDTNEYMGRVLLSIETELLESYPSLPKKPKPLPVTFIKEDEIFTTVDVMFFCAIFNVDCISSKFTKGNVTFEITMGQRGVDDKGSHCVTSPIVVETHNHNNFLDIRSSKPTLFYISAWPDFRFRMFNTNMLSRITSKLKSDLTAIEAVLKIDQRHDYLPVQFGEAIDILEKSCQEYINVARVIEGVRLDEMRSKMCLTTVKRIAAEAKAIPRGKFKKRHFRKAQTMLTRLEEIVDDVQDCWPDIILWMSSSSKRIGYHRIPARDLCFSENRNECGKLCGQVDDIFILPINAIQGIGYKTDGSIVARLRLFLWVGLHSDRQQCFNSLPQGFLLPKKFNTETQLPTFVEYSQETNFEARVHIFQGRLNPGADSTGMCDPYVRVYLATQSYETQVIKQSLNPEWDETVILRNIRLFGGSDFIENHAPSVLYEVYDLDKFRFSCELQGRAFVKPVVKFLSNNHTAEKDVLRLQWVNIEKEKDVVGELLTVAELQEVIVDADEVYESNEVVEQIPVEIRPRLVKFRMEVLFWGIRQLSRTYCYRNVNRPKITISITSTTVKSTTIKNAAKSLNFSQPFQYVDLELPEGADLCPPISIKMFDCRSFGRFTFVGASTTNSKFFLYQPFTRREYEKLKEEIVPEQLSAKEVKKLMKAERKKKTTPVKSFIPKPKKDFFHFNFWNTKPEDYGSIKPPKHHKSCFEWTWLLCTCKGPCIPIIWLFFGVCKLIVLPCKIVEHVYSWHLRPRLSKKLQKGTKIQRSPVTHIDIDEDEICNTTQMDLDWWSRYFASVGADNVNQSVRISRLKIYNSELENHQEFSNFEDYLTSFKLYRGGKRTDDDVLDEDHLVGVFKGALKIYRYPFVGDDNDGERGEDEREYLTREGNSMNDFILKSMSNNDPVRVLIRVYIVRLLSLRSKDINSYSDPYLRIKLGKNRISDRKNVKYNQPNAIFGKCFEFDATFPEDYLLTVQIWDHDVASCDDFVGETKIDVENRYYTKHFASCGIALNYCKTGYNAWRGMRKPSQILELLCEKYNLGTPIITKNGLKVDTVEFAKPNLPDNCSDEDRHEIICLSALHNWKKVPIVGFNLVPEHVETRSLYNPMEPFVEQGKIHLWIDIFPIRGVPSPTMVNIEPREPSVYELRIIVWNTEDVILVDDVFFSGEKVSDIYVKGWVTTPAEAQVTDVHYHSLTGEGRFNWRFVFPIYYLAAENMMWLKKGNSSLFSVSGSEQKIPCKLNLQIWDNDDFTADDFLGGLTLELARCPRGTKTSHKCNLHVFDPKAPLLNLFKTKRVRGWWPMQNNDKKTSETIMTGKIQLEIELLSMEEAALSPVGHGREPPNPLPEPKRPDTSFQSIFNPLRSLEFCLKVHHRKVVIFVFMFFGLLFFVVAIYSVPGYIVKKLMHA